MRVLETTKTATGTANGIRKVEQLGGPLDRIETQTTAQRKELVLAALRTVCRRLEHIRSEVELSGVALSTGSIDPQTAIRWTEEIAPGCLPIEVNATFIAKGWNRS